MKSVRLRRNFQFSNNPQIPNTKPNNNDSVKITNIPELIPAEFLKLGYPPSKILGPYAVQTPCFSNIELTKNGTQTTPKQLVYIFLSDDGTFRPKLATDSFYHDISRDQATYAKILKNKGITYDWNPDGTSYLCSDLTY